MTDKDKIYPEGVSVNRVCFCNNDILSSEISEYLDRAKKLPVKLFDKYHRRKISGVKRTITYSNGENPQFYVSDSGFVEGEKIITKHGERWKSLIGVYDFCAGDLKNLRQPKEQTQNHEFS